MSTDLPNAFRSETAELRRQIEAERHLTPTERLRAVAEALVAAEKLSESGGRRAAQLAYHQSCEEEWRRRMNEFISQYADT